MEINEKDIIKNSDGTISIKPEIFVMPYANVIIEAEWEFINPKTGIPNYEMIIMLISIVIITLYVTINKK